MRKLRKIRSKIYTILTTKPCLSALKKDGLKYGRNLNVQNYVSIDISHCWLIEIGDNVTMAPYSMILAHDASTQAHIKYTKIGRVKIGDRVFIGAKAVVLPGVKIGNDVIVGSGAIVTKDVPDGVVVAGVPAKVVCKIEYYLNKFKYLKKELVFDESYTVNGGIDKLKKQEMKKRLGDKIGLVR